MRYLLIAYNNHNDRIINEYFETLEDMNNYIAKFNKNRRVLNKFELKEVK